jgi:hypothetical protein
MPLVRNFVRLRYALSFISKFEVPSPIILPEFSQADKSRLTKIPFIPVESAGDNGEIRRMQPIQCHFPTAEGAEFYSKLFTFVDFGPRANTFLASCGTKQPPSIDEIAKILLADPKKFYELAGSPEK